MKKINVIILFFAVLFLFFSCSEPSENLYSKSKGPKVESKEEPIIVDSKKDVAYSKEFTTAGSYTWEVPSNIVGDITASIVGGGGGGAGSWFEISGAGGGAGQRITENIKVITGETITIIIGGGGSGGIAGINSKGGNGQNSTISTITKTHFALAGNGAYFTAGGSGYPSGNDYGNWVGGSGGDNGGGCGNGGSSGNSGLSAPATSGGGGGGAGSRPNDSGHSGGNGSSGYVRIDYTVHE